MHGLTGVKFGVVFMPQESEARSDNLIFALLAVSPHDPD